MTVNYEQFQNEKKAFFAKHNHDFNICTSPMDEYDRYCKDYLFADGHVWHEDYSPVWMHEIVQGKYCGKISVDTKMFRTEYYNTENADSKYYYEKY